MIQPAYTSEPSTCWRYPLVTYLVDTLLEKKVDNVCTTNSCKISSVLSNAYSSNTIHASSASAPRFPFLLLMLSVVEMSNIHALFGVDMIADLQ